MFLKVCSNMGDLFFDLADWACQGSEVIDTGSSTDWFELACSGNCCTALDRAVCDGVYRG